MRSYNSLYCEVFWNMRESFFKWKIVVIFYVEGYVFLDFRGNVSYIECVDIVCLLFNLKSG